MPEAAGRPLRLHFPGRHFRGLAFLAVVVLGFALRAPDLVRRPMHTDEAVHAVKLGSLLEGDGYRYDSSDYHGPTLNYFTLIPAWIASSDTLGELDEAVLRSVPVAFGLGIVLLLPLLMPALGKKAVLAAGLLMAISPAMVFYSRYYIQETLLVFFSFALMVCGYRYARSRRLGWALAAGVALGLAHATKETALLNCGAMVLALVVVTATARGRRSRAGTVTVSEPGTRAALVGRLAVALVAALLTAAAVSALFYSSFFDNPSGVIDSYTTYFGYFARAEDHPWHLHPWSYYLGMFAYFRGPSGPVWSEGLILLLAAAGIGAVAAQKHLPGADPPFLRFLSIYTVVLLLVYSLIPYKTPWNLLSALHGLVLLAGVGTVALLDVPRLSPSRLALAALLALAAVHLGRQAYRASFELHSDPGNPYVYAHPTADVVRIAERIQALASLHPEGQELRIDVIGPGSDYWPLPWYLRPFPNTGWWQEVDQETPAAPVILFAPSVESDLLNKLYRQPPPGERSLYVPLFDRPIELRAGVEIRGYVVHELWDTFLRERDSPRSQATP